VPANFGQPQLPLSAGALNFGCGTTVLTTALGDGGIGWTNMCAGNPQAPDFAIVPVGNQNAVLLFADGLTVDAGSVLRAVGQRPLIIAVRGNVTVAGTIDVGSTKTQRGAGSNNDCVPTGAGGDGGVRDGGPGGLVLSGGGGGGAAFGTDGTNGTGSETSAPGGLRGLAFGLPTLEPLHGGCRGGSGGLANQTWGFGGNGGGAVQVSATGAVLVMGSGTVTAYGAGGKGGQEDQHIGGGGAGSGGGILLEGNTIVVQALGSVTANGGGGGGGSGYNATFYGADGADGDDRSATVALGGNRGVCGGNGGNGATRLAPAGPAGGPMCGMSIPGGGGGGGVGRIRFNAATSCTLIGGNVVSPQATGNRAGCF
jgi:hypothetical protein